MSDYLTIPYTKNYCLHLRDENDWNIICDEHNIKMVDKFATIMQLKECKLNGSSRLIFSAMEEDKTLVSKAIFPEKDLLTNNSEWKCYDYSSRNILIWCNSSTGDVIYKVDGIGQDNNEYTSMWLSLRQIYNRSICLGGLPFHAGLAEIDGQGVLFAASGGTGKSTCCRRLPDYWKPLCDDETLVVLDNRNEYQAHPFPTWSEYLRNHSNKTWDVQYSVPLSAIFFLEQANNDEVIPIEMREASILMTESASQISIYYMSWTEEFTNILENREEIIELRKAIFNNAFNMAMNIPAFYLRVSLNGKFWEEVENVLNR